MTTLLWAADFELTKSTVHGEFTSDGQFRCTDRNVEEHVDLTVGIKEKVSPICVTPPDAILAADWSDSASIAAAFFWAVFDLYPYDVHYITFYGQGYLTADVLAEDGEEDRDALDSGYDAVKRVDEIPPSQLFDENDELTKARIDWRDHPMHAVHDAIVEHYQPLIVRALRGSISDVDAAIEAVRRTMTKAQPNPQQQAAIDAIRQSVQIARTQLDDVLRQMIADAAVSGSRVAATQIGVGGQILQGLGDEATSIDWAKWEPGWAQAADLAAMDGISKLLDASQITINGMNDTDLNRLGNIIADGLANGTPSRDIASTIADQMDNVDNIDSRAYLIATTEVSRAMNAATLDTYDQNEIEQWEWLAQNGEDGDPDDRVCEECLDRDGETYDVGGDDPIPPAHPRCRCAMMPALPQSSQSSEDGSDSSEDGQDSSQSTSKRTRTRLSGGRSNGESR